MGLPIVELLGKRPPSKLIRWLLVALSIPFGVLFCLYVLVCFPLFAFTTFCSLCVTVTRVSVMLLLKRFFKYEPL